MASDEYTGRPVGFDPNEELMPEGINTANEFLLAHGGATIAPRFFPYLSTRQQAYRFAAWCEAMAEVLPPEAGNHTFDQIRRAIRNT